MNEDAEINIFKCLEFIRTNAKPYAKAKSERIYLEEFRKSKKSILMSQAELTGVKAANMQERDAYAHAEYKELLEALRDAIEREESLRWLMVAAQAKIEVWRSIESSRRIEVKNI